MKAFAATLLLCLAALAGQGRANIVDVAAGVPNLSILVAAVQAAGVTDTLAKPDAPLTVFAPTNGAFTELLAALNVTAEQALSDTEMLLNVLSYHVVPNVAARSTDLTDGMVLSTLLPGGNLTVSIQGPGEVYIESYGASPAKVVKADIPSGDSQGSIIHVINTVLLPAM